MQRRLSDEAVDDLVGAHLAGSPIDALAAKLGVHRTTIIDHLDRRGVEPRKAVRKTTDRRVLQAAKRYDAGESLRMVAARFGARQGTG